MNPDQWIVDSASTLDSSKIAALCDIIEEHSGLIVEHRFYRSGRAPHRFICDNPESLVEYCRSDVRPGDHLIFWQFESCCRNENIFDRTKLPNAEGKVPAGGAY